MYFKLVDSCLYVLCAFKVYNRTSTIHLISFFAQQLPGYLYSKETTSSVKCLPDYHRPAPIIWERPKFQHWEPDPSPPSCSYRSRNYHNGCRDKSRTEYHHALQHQQQQQSYHHHRRRHPDFSRYDSDGVLNAPLRHNDTNRMCDHYIAQSSAIPLCCPCEYRSSFESCDTRNQVSIRTISAFGLTNDIN